jgi:serine/threonine protein phosphatase PrpC
LAVLDYGVATHIGRRANNEDAYRLEPELGLFAVADGLGGYQGGEIASSLALRTLSEVIAEKRADIGDRWEDLLAEATRLAHQQIIARQAGELAMMGSTLAAMLIPDGAAIVCHVGDSRIYLLRGGELRQLTRDHNLYTEMLARGVEVSEDQRPLFANELTRALGLDDDGQPEIARVEIRSGDVLLLCTDGLYEPLPQEWVAQVLSESSAQDASNRLVKEAYKRGGTDNMTALVVRVVQE